MVGRLARNYKHTHKQEQQHCRLKLKLLAVVIVACCTLVGTTTASRASSKQGLSNMAIMKAIHITEPGPAENLVYTDVPRPEPGRGEVLIRVEATAVNRADTLQRKGGYAPPKGASGILGLEAAGTIVKLGDDCDRLIGVGSRVFALLSGGGYAQYCAVDQRLVMEIPDSIDMTTAGGIAETWLTAFQLLHLVGNVNAGDTVLVHAGGSGVGLAATQLAVHAGARVIATASDGKLAACKDAGASVAIDRNDGAFAPKVLEATEGKGADVILDCIGGSYWEQNAESIAVDGRWVLYGLLGGPNVDGPILRSLLRKRASIRATTLRSRPIEYRRELVARFKEEALPKLADGTFKVVIDSKFPLEEAAAAHKHMEANKNTGKIVMLVSHDDAKGHEEL